MKKLLQQALIVILLSMPAYFAGAQDCNFSKVLNTKTYSITTLESKWSSYTKDPGFKALLDALTKEGFTRLVKNEKTAWGFEASYISDTALGTSEQDAEICSFDFYKKTAKGGQMASMIWRKVGGTIYKAYILFPEGEKDYEKAFEKSIEYYADENGKIQLAHSFGKCWAKCVFKRFKATNCGNAMLACGGASAGLIAAGIGVTTPMALGIFGGCAGVFCLAPLAICAAYCL